MGCVSYDNLVFRTLLEPCWLACFLHLAPLVSCLTSAYATWSVRDEFSRPDDFRWGVGEFGPVRTDDSKAPNSCWCCLCCQNVLPWPPPLILFMGEVRGAGPLCFPQVRRSLACLPLFHISELSVVLFPSVLVVLSREEQEKMSVFHLVLNWKSNCQQILF